jgi:hypothetical protein
MEYNMLKLIKKIKRLLTPPGLVRVYDEYAEERREITERERNTN